MLSVALGVTATLAAAPRVVDTESVPTLQPVSSSAPAKRVSPIRRWFEIGKASWYGGQFNGRKTANGETFDSNTLTAAHRTLPLGSWIRVTNLHNNKSVLVKVNDRGPMVENVVLDLSYAAAQRLGIDGLAKVRIETMPKQQVMPAMPPLQDLAEVSAPRLHDYPFSL